MKIKSLAFCTRLRLVRPPFKDELSCSYSKIGIVAKLIIFFKTVLSELKNNSIFAKIKKG